MSAEKKYRDEQGNEYTYDELTDIMGEIITKILYRFPEGLEEKELKHLTEKVWFEMGLPEI